MPSKHKYVVERFVWQCKWYEMGNKNDIKNWVRNKRLSYNNKKQGDKWGSSWY